MFMSMFYNAIIIFLIIMGFIMPKKQSIKDIRIAKETKALQKNLEKRKIQQKELNELKNKKNEVNNGSN